MNEQLRITRTQVDPDAMRAAGRQVYMCRHQSGRERSMEEITASHDLDLVFQEEYGLRWLGYFSHRDAMTTFCVVEAPSKEAVEACHARAHGDMPSYPVIEVDWNAVRAFLGEIGNPDVGQVWSATPFRTLLLVDAANASDLALGMGDAPARALLQSAQTAVEDAVHRAHGSVVKMEPGSLLASFTSASRAVECTLAILAPAPGPSQPVVWRAGLNAGEPVTDGGALFGAAVQICREVCGRARPRSALVSGVVHDLCAGKGFQFSPAGSVQLPDEDMIRLYEVQVPPDVSLLPRPTPYPDGLTKREVEVLALIAAGRSNQQIADALVISLNTVARHVANILDKTGSVNRTEAASYAYRERLL